MTGSATTLVTAGGANFTVNATNGDGLLQFVGGSGSSVVRGGEGGASIFGGASGDITYQNNVVGAHPLFYQAGGGNETLNAFPSTAVTSDTLAGGTVGASAATIIGGSVANDTFVAGTGSDSYIGGSGANTFLFNKAVINATSPNDSITGFLNSTVTGGNQAIFQGYGTAEASTALKGAVSGGGDTTLTLSDNTKITFVGVGSASQLAGHVSST